MAQLVEHIVHIDGVTGSSPVGTTKQRTTRLGGFLFVFRMRLNLWAQRCETSMGRGAEAPPVADAARRKRGEQRSEASVSAAMQRGRIEFAPLPETDKENILLRNAQRLFHLAD